MRSRWRFGSSSIIAQVMASGDYITVKSLIYVTPSRNTLMFLVSSCSCPCPIHWSQVSSREWICSWSSADRRCSNYIWMINNFIDYQGASYIRGLTVLKMVCIRNHISILIVPHIFINILLVDTPLLWNRYRLFIDILLCQTMQQYVKIQATKLCRTPCCSLHLVFTPLSYLF